MKSEEISCLDRLSFGTRLVCSGCSQEADRDQRKAVLEKYAKEAIFDNNYLGGIIIIFLEEEDENSEVVP